MRRFQLTALVVAMTAPSPGAWAQPAPLGPEFQVNTYTTGYQGQFHGPSVAADAAGNFVVVWQREQGYAAVARRYSSDGTPLGPEFIVNGDGYYPYPEYLEGAKPEVASDAAGNFVVVWETYDCAGYGGRVCARRFDSSGAAVGPEFQVDSGSYFISNPKVAMDAAGGFVVVWPSYENGEFPVQARQFDSSGVALGPQFQVNTYTTGCCGYSIIDEDWNAVDVAVDTTGDFLVIWNRDAGDDEVHARVFDSGGTPAGGEFQVNTTTLSSYVTGVAVDANGADRFVTVWDYSASINGRRFDDTGTALGGEFQVIDDPLHFEFDPDVTADESTGVFVVVWTGADDDGDGIGVRAFGGNETPLGPSFTVNTYTTSYQHYPGVAMQPAGGFVVAWQSYYQDGDGDAIIGRRFDGADPPAALGCSATPKTGCRQPTKEKKGRLLLRDKAPDDRDRLVWKWPRGEATARADFGDPLTTTDYALCVYDGSADPQPRLESRAPAGGDCPGRPCWVELTPERLEYKDRDVDPDGMLLMRLRTGIEGKTLLLAKGQGGNLAMPTLPLTTPVRAQLQAANGECWESVYSQFIVKNQADIFKAKPDAPVPTTSTTTTTTPPPTTTTTLSSPSRAFLEMAAGVID